MKEDWARVGKYVTAAMAVYMLLVIILIFTLAESRADGRKARAYIDDAGARSAGLGTSPTRLGSRLPQILGDNRAKTPKWKIAIIDTGYMPGPGDPKLKLCPKGHYDFVANKPKIVETGISHGTYVANIIAAELKDVDYCALIYRVYAEDETSAVLINRSIRAYKAAAEEGAIAVNYSIQGFAHSYIERAVLEALTRDKFIMFVGAGNDNIDLDKQCLSYPSCYGLPRVIAVGAVCDSDPQTKTSYSNYGTKVNVWFSGMYYDPAAKVRERGTSFSAPRALSDYILSLARRAPK